MTRKTDLSADVRKVARTELLSVPEHQALSAAIAAGQADPAADAAAAARAGRFGMFLVGARSAQGPGGVIGFTPRGMTPGVRANFSGADVYTKEVTRRHSYARAYNLALIEQPDFPFADLFRPVTNQESAARRQNGRPLMGEAAVDIAGPSKDLHQAARRGPLAEVEQMAGVGELDRPDAFGMTALAWAVARDRPEIVEALLKRGSDPFAASATSHSPVYTAVALGRVSLLERLLRNTGARRPASYTAGDRWPADYIVAAVYSGEPDMVRRLVGEPHEPVSRHAFRHPQVKVAALRPLLAAREPHVADDVLADALDVIAGEAVALDLIKAALDNGADPNARSVHGATALGLAANGIYAGKPEAVDLLVRFGADVDLPSEGRRPVWIAVGALTLSEEWKGDTDEPAYRILMRLLAAGADLNAPDEQDRPGAWGLLFPYRHTPEELDDSFVSSELLTLLVAQGLNLNAPSNTRRLLDLVEEQAGPQAPLTRDLRRLGARRS